MAMQQYLERYAEIEASRFDNLDGLEFNYHHLLCIPAYAESPDFLHQLIAQSKEQSVLIILVVNARAEAPPAQISLSREIATYLKQQYPSLGQFADNIQLLKMTDTIDILLVERCMPGYYLQGDDGVGLARKIACDIACRLITLGKIKNHWIHSTDADAILPADYFSTATALDTTKTSAAVYPFHHTPHENEKVQQAQTLYDLSMDYYVAGLKWAESCWAYHTIGSTLLINPEHYALARGFPKRQAGEDFYLLNKLSKIGDILTLNSTPIALASRLSDRVPFGTGPALNKIMLMQSPLEEFLFYHPHCFVYLKGWLAFVHTLQAGKDIVLSAAIIEQFVHANEKYAALDSQLLMNCLESLGASKALAHAFSHSKSDAVLKRHIQNWFDGFITLKFIHWMRDNCLPSVPASTVKTIQHEKNLPFLSCLAFEDYAPVPPA
ncbi:hypothetical protein N9E57_00140 [Gammaproteobacteria bacterium]|nr:hypothetical protein [Gammaproteobacteria bacterium]